MKIYTCHNGKHLYLHVPLEWTAEDVQFFIRDKPQLKIDDETTQPADGPIILVPATPIGPLSTVGRCPTHAAYSGMRMGAKARECPTCLAFYNSQRQIGIK